MHCELAAPQNRALHDCTNLAGASHAIPLAEVIPSFQCTIAYSAHLLQRASTSK